MDWFLCRRDLYNERVKGYLHFLHIMPLIYNEWFFLFEEKQTFLSQNI